MPKNNGLENCFVPDKNEENTKSFSLQFRIWILCEEVYTFIDKANEVKKKLFAKSSRIKQNWFHFYVMLDSVDHSSNGENIFVYNNLIQPIQSQRIQSFSDSWFCMKSTTNVSIR